MDTKWAERETAEISIVMRFLHDRRGQILEQATEAGRRAHLPHYEAEASIEQRLTALFDLLVESVSTRDLGRMIDYSQNVAAARFMAGFDLSEVQTVFNLLEEAVWTLALKVLPANSLALAIGLISTVLAAGKDALARAYVAQATRTHVPTLDLSRLFSGTENPGQVA